MKENYEIQLGTILDMEEKEIDRLRSYSGWGTFLFLFPVYVYVTALFIKFFTGHDVFAGINYLQFIA